MKAIPNEKTTLKIRQYEVNHGSGKIVFPTIDGLLDHLREVLLAYRGDYHKMSVYLRSYSPEEFQQKFVEALDKLDGNRS